MDERTVRLLEFPKIRLRLAASTVTAAGRERAEALEPSIDAREVADALEETAESATLVTDGEVPLRGTADIRDLVHRAAIGSTLDAPELLAVRDTLATIRQCRGFVLARRDRAPRLAGLAGAMGTFEPLKEAIRRTIADDGTIPDEASRELARIRREQRTAAARLREKLDELLRGPYARMLQDPIITSRGDRYVVPVRQEFKGTFPGVLHDQSSSGATAFMEPLAAVPLGNRLRELGIEEREEIARLLRELSGRVGAEAEEIHRAYGALGHIDFAVAKAHLAGAMHATRPRVREGGALRLAAARHPLLVGDVVPIDVELGEAFTALVITGPNTGGKTVTLKTIGLLTLMAQAGLFIPAAEGSEVAVFPQVYADIGDEQSIEQSLSTFSSHMGAIAGILRKLDGPSPSSPGAGAPGALVLLDEIGAGTDPTEGVALARTLIEHLHARGVRTVVTTHYNELKALAYTHAGIQNASVEFDTETLRPTYRLRIGLPGRSNALIIAARLGLDPALVEQARGLLGREAVEIDRILSDLETDRKAYEYELSQAARLRADAETLRAGAEAERDRLRRERQKMLSRAREEADAMLARARREIEALSERLRASGSPEAVRQARAHLRQIAATLQEAMAPEPDAPGEPLTEARPGDAVVIASLKRSGIVLAPPDAKGEVEVDAGGMRVRVALSGLRRAPEAPAPAPERTRSGEIAPDEPVPLSLSLRGETVDEALPRLDKYLDDAFVAGLPRVTIIHGKGTGALRRAVHDFLRSHPHVRTFRLGERGEGETGATIVELDVA